MNRLRTTICLVVFFSFLFVKVFHYSFVLYFLNLRLFGSVQNTVEVEEFRRARRDSIAHSCAKIISRIRAGAEKNRAGPQISVLEI